jgi:polyhydroxyalkanoate synthesis regulator phasin
MSADAADTQERDPAQATLQRIDELISQLERAAEQLRSGELSADAAATVVEDCAALATEASGELDRLARADQSAIDSLADAPPQQVPGQDSLL